MAARTHAMDQVLFRSVAARARRARECRPPHRRQSADLRLAHLFGHQPGVHGLDVGGLVASDGRCHPARHGGRARDAAAAGRRRGHRAGRRGAVGRELDRGHGPVSHHPQHRRRRQRGAGDRPAGDAGAGGERLAAGVASRARPGALAAVPALPQASAAALSDARRDRAGRGRDLADLDGVPKRPPHPARRAAARRRRQRLLHALPRRLQYRDQYGLCGRRQGVVSSAAGHSGRRRLVPTQPDGSMTTDPQAAPPWSEAWRVLARKDVLAGALFMAVAILGLWISRDYPIGTAFRMGTGYVPRLLCWILLGLGGVVLVQGLREVQGQGKPPADAGWAWRPVVFVTASLAVFGLAIERLGLVVSIVLLIGVGAVAARALRPLETVAAALVLIVLSWAIFIFGLGLTIPVWPEW